MHSTHLGHFSAIQTKYKLREDPLQTLFSLMIYYCNINVINNYLLRN